MRVLAIDPGILNLSYCVLDRSEKTFVVEQWKNVSVIDKSGFNCGEKRMSANSLSTTILADMTFSTLSILFPAKWVRHNLDQVCIESQPKMMGRTCKVGDVSLAIYSYFRLLIAPIALCCFRFPRVYMIGSASKFDNGQFARTDAETYTDKASRNFSYAQRKAYSIRLTKAIISSESVSFVSPEIEDGFLACSKKDDLSDSFLLALIAVR